MPEAGVRHLSGYFLGTSIVFDDVTRRSLGLRADEMQGCSFPSLDIELPVGKLEDLLVASLRGELDDQKITVEAHNRCGRAITCQVRATTRLDLEREPDGIVLLMEEGPA